MRILLTTYGSRGDFQPLLAMARGLREAGHDPVLCATPDFEAWSTGHGFEFHAFGQSLRDMLIETAKRMRTPLAAVSILRAYVTDIMRTQFAVTLQAAEGADLVVGSALHFTAASAAEAQGIPYRYVAYQPSLFRSPDLTPPLLPWQQLPAWINRPLWLLFDALNNSFMPALNAQRSEVGLPGVSDVARHFMSERPIYAADPAIAPLPGRLSISPEITGWWGYQDMSPLPDEVEAFLAAGPPPVYFGFGSMPAQDARETTSLIIEAARLAGRRAVILKGWAGLADEELPTDCLAVDSIPHAKLFPRVAAVVHHGGAGTTATAARAGVPQVAVPHVLDQFYFASRLLEIGVSPTAQWRWLLTARGLSKAIVEATSAERYQQRARALATELADVDGIAAGVRTLTTWPLAYKPCGC